MLFENKVALVTGGAGGIGRAAALGFAREGAAVMVTDVNDAGSAETVKMIEEAGGKAAYLNIDVSDEAAVKMMVDKTVTQFGALHYALNNAGVGGDMGVAIQDLDYERYQRVMDINVGGVWLCMKYEIPAILESEGGAIVNVASVAGILAISRNSAYTASKHAVIGLTKTAALENARKNLRVNAVCPAFIDTAMVREIGDTMPRIMDNILATSPMRRLGQPQEVSEAVLWLCSDAASFVTGHSMVIDGALTHH
ncbi:MAG: glucose 1-dehydrogenase [Aggregatilineales bacterium]